MDIGSLYSDYLTSTATKSSNLERTLRGDHREKSDDELLDACKQFEAYFYEQVFKNMEKAMVPSDDSDPNHTLATQLTKPEQSKLVDGEEPPHT